jgi:hypothetical protein
MFGGLLRGLAGSAMGGGIRRRQPTFGAVGSSLMGEQPGSDMGMQARRTPGSQFPERPVEPPSPGPLQLQSMNSMQPGGEQPQQDSPFGQPALGQEPLFDQPLYEDQQQGAPQMEAGAMTQMGQTPIQEQPAPRYFATPDANPSRPPQPTQAGSDEIGLPTSDPSYQYSMDGGVEAYAPQFSYRYKRR